MAFFSLSLFSTKKAIDEVSNKRVGEWKSKVKSRQQYAPCFGIMIYCCWQTKKNDKKVSFIFILCSLRMCVCSTGFRIFSMEYQRCVYVIRLSKIKSSNFASFQISLHCFFYSPVYVFPVILEMVSYAERQTSKKKTYVFHNARRI